MYYINSMVRAEEACLWLIKQNLIGKELLAFWLIKHDKSVLNVLAYINKGLDHDVSLRPIIAGKHIT